jgi:hypothetical protein
MHFTKTPTHGVGYMWSVSSVLRPIKQDEIKIRNAYGIVCIITSARLNRQPNRMHYKVGSVPYAKTLCQFTGITATRAVSACEVGSVLAVIVVLLTLRAWVADSKILFYVNVQRNILNTGPSSSQID